MSFHVQGGSGTLFTAVMVLFTMMTAHPAAHENGVLKVENREFIAGDSVRVVGEKFGRRATLTLAIVGVSGRMTLREVRTDSAGAFVQYVSIPADTRPGAYRLVAVAADGDEVATLDVAVVPAALETSPLGRSDAEVDAGEPSDEPLDLERARSPLVTGGVVAVVAVMLILGGALLRRPAGSA